MLNVSKLINENTSSSPYIVDSCDIWHGRLGHVNFSYIKKIVDLSLIPKLSLDNLRKCESWIESKTTKKSCKSVERELELPSLIHSDLGDLKNTITRGGKQFYITFINDYSKYKRVYLLRNKEEARDVFIKHKVEVENQLSKKIDLELIGKESMSPIPLTHFLKIMGLYMRLLFLILLSPME